MLKILGALFLLCFVIDFIRSRKDRIEKGEKAVDEAFDRNNKI